MDKQLFSKKLSNPWEYSVEEKRTIMDAKKEYPYCSLLQLLDLLSDKAAGIQQWKERYYPRVALYVPDRSLLTQHLNQTQPIKAMDALATETRFQIEQHKNDSFASEGGEGYDIMKEINAYQEVSFKTAPKSVILSQFLDVTGGRGSEKGGGDYVAPAETDKKSLKQHSPLETETFAVILEKQGKYQQAAEVYRKIIEKNPEKSSIFATRLEELEKKIDNQK